MLTENNSLTYYLSQLGTSLETFLAFRTFQTDSGRSLNFILQIYNRHWGYNIHKTWFQSYSKVMGLSSLQLCTDSDTIHLGRSSSFGLHLYTSGSPKPHLWLYTSSHRYSGSPATGCLPTPRISWTCMLLSYRCPPLPLLFVSLVSFNCTLLPALFTPVSPTTPNLYVHGRCSPFIRQSLGPASVWAHRHSTVVMYHPSVSVFFFLINTEA